MEELKKIKENFKVYPEWLLKLFSVSNYNKVYDIKGFKFTTQHIKILSLVLLAIIMFISYSNNGDKPTTLVWMGVVVFIAFMIFVFMILGFSIYSNYKIKQICKKYGVTIEYWNSL